MIDNLNFFSDIDEIWISDYIFKINKFCLEFGICCFKGNLFCLKYILVGKVVDFIFWFGRCVKK